MRTCIGADAGLLDFLGYLRQSGTGMPLLLLCTARPELYARAPAFGGGSGDSAVLALGSLSRVQTARLIAAVVGEPALPAGIDRLLFERTGGNPLYAEEFVRLLRDKGLLGAGHDGTVFASTVPESVQVVIAARLDTLGAEDKALLHDAAVMGTEFLSRAVVAAAGRDEPDVQARLRALVRLQFLRAASAAPDGDGGEYAFWHDLVRDVAYGQLPRAARATKHQAVAAWLEARAGERIADQSEMLAHHYRTALELVTTAGGVPTAELERKTIRFSILAGDRAVHLAPKASKGHYRKALKLLADDDVLRPKLLLKLGTASKLLGEKDAAEDAYRASIEAGLQTRDQQTVGGAQVQLAISTWRGGNTAASHALAAEAHGVLRDLGPCPNWAGHCSWSRSPTRWSGASTPP